MASIAMTKREKEDITVDEPEVGLGEWEALEEPDPVVEKSKFMRCDVAFIRLTRSSELVRKFDAIILPLLCIVYFTHSLDRANLGNAKTDNLEKIIGLKENQYSLILVS